MNARKRSGCGRDGCDLLFAVTCARLFQAQSSPSGGKLIARPRLDTPPDTIRARAMNVLLRKIENIFGICTSSRGHGFRGVFCNFHGRLRIGSVGNRWLAAIVNFFGKINLVQYCKVIGNFPFQSIRNPGSVTMRYAERPIRVYTALWPPLSY